MEATTRGVEYLFNRLPDAYKRKPARLERSSEKRELSARAAFFFVDGGSITHSHTRLASTLAGRRLSRRGAELTRRLVA